MITNNNISCRTNTNKNKIKKITIIYERSEYIKSVKRSF